MRLKVIKSKFQSILRSNRFFLFLVIVKPSYVCHLINDHFRSGKIEINQSDKVLALIDQNIGKVLIALKNTARQILVNCFQL